ncbi:hypothetical protein [Panacagrimonas perspica]|nr:hypothetical protein [Panacagrimonas perspica]
MNGAPGPLNVPDRSTLMSASFRVLGATSHQRAPASLDRVQA